MKENPAAWPATPSARNRDVDRRSISLSSPKFPKLPRALVAKRGAISTGQHCSHPPAFPVDCLTADGEDPAVNRMDPAGPGKRPYLTVGIAERIELTQRHHAALLRNQPRQAVAGVRDAFLGHTGDNASSTRISPRT